MTTNMRRFYQYCRIKDMLFLTALCLMMPHAHATVEYALQTGLHWYKTDNPLLVSNRPDNYSATQYDNSSGLYRPGDYQKYIGTDGYWTHDLGAGIFIPLPTQRSFLQLVGKTSQEHNNTYTTLSNRKKQWEALYQWEMSSWLRGKFRHYDDIREYDYFNGFPKNLFTYYDPASGQKHTAGGSYLVEPHLVENEMELGLKITPHWEIPFNIKRQRVAYLHDNDTSPFNFNTKSYMTGIRYESAKHSVFSLGFRRTQTHFPIKGSVEFYRYNPVDLLSGVNTGNGQPLDCMDPASNHALCDETVPAYFTSYEDNEIFSDNVWQFGPRTILRSNLSFTKRKFNQGQQNNVYDIELGADWAYSPKTSFIFQVWNRVGTINTNDNRRTLQIHGAQLYVTWQATYKSRFTAMSSIEQEHYTYFDTQNLSPVSDKTLHLGLQYDYDINPRTRFSAYIHQRSSKSRDGTLFKRTNFWTGITYTFENMQGNNHARIRLDQLQ